MGEMRAKINPTELPNEPRGHRRRLRRSELGTKRAAGVWLGSKMELQSEIPQQSSYLLGTWTELKNFGSHQYFVPQERRQVTASPAHNASGTTSIKAVVENWTLFSRRLGLLGRERVINLRASTTESRCGPGGSREAAGI